MIDDLTMSKMYQASASGNASLVREKIEVISNAQRVLDGPPEKYAPMKVDTDSVQPFSVYNLFCSSYHQIYEALPEEECILCIDGKDVKCEHKLFVALRTLMNFGVTSSVARAVACREIFGTVISHVKGDTLTAADVMPAMRLTGDYYKNEFIHAMIDCIYTKEEQVEMLLKIRLGDDYGPDASKLLGCPGDEEALDKAILATYKRASCDPDYVVKKHLGRAVNAVRYIRWKSGK